MFKKIFLFILIFTSLTVFSQDTLVKKWKFAFQLDNRFSSIRNNKIIILGFKAGVQYENYTRFGLGVSFLTSPVSINYFNKKLNEPETNKFNFWYVSIFDDLILYQKHHFDCFITEQIGYGKPAFIKEINDQIVSDTNVGLFVNEISAQTDYAINSWFGVGAGVGYRNILNNKSSLKTTFNAPVYIVKIIIHPEYLFEK